MIDRPRFEEYIRYFDKEVIIEVIDIFIREYPTRIGNLNKNIDELDFKLIAGNSHELKGAAANFMAPDVLSLVRKLEEMAKQEDAEGLKKLFIELKSATELLIEELQIIRQELLS